MQHVRNSKVGLAGECQWDWKCISSKVSVMTTANYCFTGPHRNHVSIASYP